MQSHDVVDRPDRIRIVPPFRRLPFANHFVEERSEFVHAAGRVAGFGQVVHRSKTARLIGGMIGLKQGERFLQQPHGLVEPPTGVQPRTDL
jgi:hypothetical protein